MAPYLSSFDVRWAFAVLAVTIGAAAFVPYIRDTLRGRTQPHRATWLIWSVLSSVSAGALVAAGETTGLAYVGIQWAATLAIFALSLVRGTGALLRGRDAAALAMAGLGVGLWWVTDSPGWALGLSVGVSLLGGIMTVAKAHAAPGTETLACWVASALGALFGVLAVGRLDPMGLAYPSYLLVLYTAIVLALLAGRHRERQAQVAAWEDVLAERGRPIRAARVASPMERRAA
ncbi:MAG: hypothetical protein ACU0CO_03165 [Shimia sp.]